jgi:hydrogenase expression/formation protein HypE
MGKVTLSHGDGGAVAQELLSSMFLKHLTSPVLHCLEDCALLEEHRGRLAFSTDCYINEPLFFPGGNIGSLAVNGTINNLAMRGAMPLALSLGLVIEEGFPLVDLDRIISAIAASSSNAEVAVVTGDTKVVPCGKIAGICLNISGIGLVVPGTEVSGSNAEAGDAIIISGTLGDHGLAIRNQNCHPGQPHCVSGSRPLHFLVHRLLEAFPYSLHAMRDPTRGGLATSLVWLASASGVCMEIEEKSIPISENVRRVCARDNLDPLYLASEGTCIMCCEQEDSEDILDLMRSMEAGANAAIIGRVSASPMGRVRLHTTAAEWHYLEAL